MTNKDFLGTQPVGSLLLKLAIPTVTAQIINMLYNVVDRIYIGHIPGSGALALTGVGVCMPVILLVSAFAALVGMGGAPRASIFMGKGDYKGSEKIIGNCFTTQILISIILSVVILIWNEPILLAFGASGNTIGYATDYLSVYAIGTIAVQITLGMNAFITTQGFTKVSMYSVIIGAITNIILDPIFIFGLGLGVKGAALATIISQSLSAIWIIHFLFGNKTTIKIRKENLRIQPKIILPCLELGLASFIMQGSESVINICFNSSLLKYGGDIAVGAMTILTSIMQLVMMPLQGIGQGAQPIISYNYGAENRDRVIKAFKLLLVINFTFAFVVWGLIQLFPSVFARIFTSDENLIAFTSRALRIYMGATGIFGIQIACQMTFTSIGFAKESITVAIMRKFILLIPLIFILPLFISNKTAAVYTAEPIADLISVLFTIVLFSGRFKKAMKELGK